MVKRIKDIWEGIYNEIGMWEYILMLANSDDTEIRKCGKSQIKYIRDAGYEI